MAAGGSEVAAQLQRNTRGLSCQTSRSGSLDGPSEVFSSLATHSRGEEPVQPLHLRLQPAERGQVRLSEHIANSVTLICADQGLVFLLFSLVTPRNLDTLFIASGRSAAACSRINATAPSTPSASRRFRSSPIAVVRAKRKEVPRLRGVRGGGSKTKAPKALTGVEPVSPDGVGAPAARPHGALAQSLQGPASVPSPLAPRFGGAKECAAFFSAPGVLYH